LPPPLPPSLSPLRLRLTRFRRSPLQSWADDSTLRLKRRAILKWEDGRPSRVLIVKKPGDMAAAQKLQEIGQWLAQHGVQVMVERPVAAAEAKQFDAFDPETHAVDLAITLGGAHAPGQQGSLQNWAMRCSGRPAHGPPLLGELNSRKTPLFVAAIHPLPPLLPALRRAGDGTVLHLASLFKEDAPLPPTLSFAMGTLGFLTPFNASMSRAVLSRLLWPPWEDEPVFCTLRSRKRCEVHHGGQLQRVHSVLNECTVDRGASPAIVMLECFVDGRHVTTVHADALIISTPSGERKIKKKVL
jgi:NAD+ kinase